ncbi:MAG: hypothetical protein E4H38_05190 [Gemmatimonadales bacterium]|nr:MAG: hypothetical protein E4H38_05190 [Gemmatimonadales bacterium]
MFCLLCLCASQGGFAGEPIDDDVVISKEAEATRAGARYNWDLQAIRESLEAQAARIKYAGAGKGAVATVPTAAQLKEKTVEELFALCKHWNPAVASAAAGELGRQGVSVYDKVMANCANADPAIRAASARVITDLIGKLRSAPRDSEFRAFMLKRYPAIVSMVGTMIRDSDLQVRRSIQGAYSGVGVTAREVSVNLEPMITAAVRQASVEGDPYLCQDLIISTRKFNWHTRLDKKTRAELLGKLLLQQPFPRGRGSVVAMIEQLPPKEILSVLPALLEHFKTPLLRDTMFFPGGAPEAFVLIAKHRAGGPEVFKEALAHIDRLNRQAWVSLGGNRGKQLHGYWECLASLGREAAVALPSLELLVAETEGEAAAYGRSVIERISK